MAKTQISSAVVIAQSVWVLPVDEKYLTFMHGIANEIVQNGGEAYVMRAELVNGNNPDAITKIFCRERGEEYQKLEQYKERLEVFSQ